jgi:hypothetical protein
MPRIRTGVSLDEIIRAATAPVVVRASNVIARAVANMVAEELEEHLRKAAPRRRRRAAGRSRSRKELTKWVADRRARRVPNFAIEMTGLDTKKKIVAKYGENAEFVKGRPLPPVKTSGIAARNNKAARVVSAKPRIARTAAG